MNNIDKIEQKVMGEIKSGKVKLRSKYIFLAERLGLRSAILLSILLAVLFFNLTLFYLRESDNLSYLSFGSNGFLAFLESFPYGLIVGLVLLVFVAGFIIKSSGIFYKKSFKGLLIGLVGFIFLAGLFLTFTNVAERIEKESYRPHPAGMFFRPLLHRGSEKNNHGIAGMVTEIGDNFINIQTPNGIIKIDLNKLHAIEKDKLTVGVFVMAIGDKRGDIFEARDLRVADENEMPMIRRGVHERFGLPQPMIKF